jgi:mannose-6-phosphate isomerase-like protein (cupin superfamily)
MSDVLEAHFAREDLEAKEFGLSLQRIKPNARLPFGHTHNKQEEVYVVVSGSGRIKLDDEVIDVAQWDAVRVSPEVMRAFEASGDGLELLAFGAPNVGSGDAQQEMGWWSEAD